MRRPASAYPLRLVSVLLLLGTGTLVLACGGQNGPDDTTSSTVVPDEEVEQKVEAARQRLTQNEGGKRVLRAIDAHGGLEAWYRAPTSSYTWEYANKSADVRFKSFLVVDNRTRRAYHDLLTRGSYDDARPVDARFAWTGERAWIAPDSIERPNPRFWALSGFYFQQIPFVLADPGLTYEALPDDSIDGTPHDMVRVGFESGVGDSPDDTYTLYLDKETGRVDAIRYAATFGRDVEDPSELSKTFFDYQDYTTVHGLTVPTRFEGYSYSGEDGPGDQLRNEAVADSLSYRRSFDASMLEPPDNARVVSLPES
jgi:hypothetical protein